MCNHRITLAERHLIQAIGSLAASMHDMGNAAVASALALLMSASYGGQGLSVINSIAASSVMAGTCSRAAVMFTEAMKKDDCNDKSKL